MNECVPLVLLSFLPLLSNLCVLVQCSAASKVLLVHLRLKLSSLVQQSQFDLLLSFIFFLFLFFLHFNSLSAIKFCNLQQCGVFAPARFQHLSSYFFSHFLCPITTLKFFFFYFSLHLSYRLFIAFTSSPSPVCVFSFFYCFYF